MLACSWDEGGEELQNAVCEALFKYYFEQEGNLGDREAMIAVTSKAGLDAAKTRAMLESDGKKADVLESVRTYASKHRITGVPYFIIDGKIKLSGAQDPDTFLEAFTDIAEHKS
jgi:predicted DsbA family dithiol-disulfide isomerase